MKKHSWFVWRILFGGIFLVFISSATHADEGMWPFNHIPKAQLKARYGFEPSEAWLDHVRMASVRFNIRRSVCGHGDDSLDHNC